MEVETILANNRSKESRQSDLAAFSLLAGEYLEGNKSLLRSVERSVAGDRPQLSRITLGLALAVTAMSSATIYCLVGNGASTLQIFLSSIGEIFLFTLVAISGLVDLQAKHASTTKMLIEKELSHISHHVHSIDQLAALRSRWQVETNQSKDELETLQRQQLICSERIREMDVLILEREKENQLLAESIQFTRSEIEQLTEKCQQQKNTFSQQSIVLREQEKAIHKTKAELDAQQSLATSLQRENSELVERSSKLSAEILVDLQRRDGLQLEITVLSEQSQEIECELSLGREQLRSANEAQAREQKKQLEERLILRSEQLHAKKQLRQTIDQEIAIRAEMRNVSRELAITQGSLTIAKEQLRKVGERREAMLLVQIATSSEPDGICRPKAELLESDWRKEKTKYIRVDRSQESITHCVVASSDSDLLIPAGIPSFR